MQRALALAAALVVLAPPAVALAYIYAYGVNAAHWDHLAYAELFDQFNRGTLSAELLLRPHLEHVKLFPRLMALALGVPSRFNNLVEMYAQWGLLCITAVTLYAVMRRTTRLAGWALTACFVPIALLLFTPRQHEALLVGDAMIAYLCVASAVAAFALLERGQTGAVLCGCAAAFVASFSHANGFLLWPIGALLLMSRVDSTARRRAALVALWVAFAGGALLLYIQHWPETASANLSYAAAHPGSTAAFAIAAGGTPFGQTPRIQVAFGWSALAIEALALAGAAVARVRGARLPFGTWLILFALGMQAFIALGRTSGDVGLGVPSRYAIFLGLGMAGAYLAALELRAGALRKARWLAGAAAAVILAGSITGYTEGLASGPKERDTRLMIAQILRTVPQQTDETLRAMLYPFPTRARRYAALLEQWRLNLFAQPLQSVEGLRQDSAPPVHVVEHVNFQPVKPGVAVAFAGGRTIIVSGWAFDQRAWRPFASGYLRIDPVRTRIPIAYGLARPDVADAYHLGRHATAGYAVTFSSDVLAPGENTVRLEFIAAEGDRVVTTPPLAILTRQ